jgi:hypothetical protein
LSGLTRVARLAGKKDAAIVVPARIVAARRTTKGSEGFSWKKSAADRVSDEQVPPRLSARSLFLSSSLLLLNSYFLLS